MAREIAWRQMAADAAAVGALAAAWLRAWPVPAASDSEGWSRLADVCRLLLCAPDLLEGSELGALCRDRLAAPDWADAVLCNQGSLLDFLAVARAARRWAEPGRSGAGGTSGDPVARAQQALARVLAGPYLLRSEWLPHHLVELAAGVGELALPVSLPPWPSFWMQSFLARTPPLWQWSEENLTALLRTLQAVGARPVEERRRLPPGHQQYLRRAVLTLLGSAVAARMPEAAAGRLLAAAVLGLPAGPTQAAAWRLLRREAEAGRFPGDAAVAAAALAAARLLPEAGNVPGRA